MSHQQLTCIEGKLYDLSEFADKHPGGPIAISMTLNRDATLLFHSYHPFNLAKVRSILSKYEVKNITKGEEKRLLDSMERFAGENGQPLFKRASTISPHDSDRSSVSSHDPIEEIAMNKLHFEQDLKNRVLPILKQTGTKASPLRWFHIAILTVLMLFITTYFFRGYWWTIVACPLIHWLWGVSFFHDASHFAMSYNWRLNHYSTYLTPYFTSPFTWYHQHVIGHHNYTNLNMDPDMQHGWYLWRYHNRMHYRKWFKFQICYYWVIWAVSSFMLSTVYDFQFMFLSSYHHVVKMIPITRRRRVLHLAGRLFTMILIFIIPLINPFMETWTKAVCFSVIPYMIFGMCFGFCSQLNHIHSQNINQYSSDWYKHQVLTSHNFCPDSLFWFFMTGGLNLQIEHHLFPGVNHWNLRRIQPIVQQCCEDHGVSYHVSPTIAEALRKHYAHIYSFSYR